MKKQFLISSLFFKLVLFSQNTWYVSQQSGNDANSGLSVSTPKKNIEVLCNNNSLVQPGDTVYLIGIFNNQSFDENYSYSGNINDSHIWTQENSIKLNNVNGEENAYITFKSYDENTILKGDGSNILRVQNCSYLKFENIHIQGQVDQIPIETSLALQFLYRENGTTNTLYRVPVGSTDEEIEQMTLPLLPNIFRPSYTDTRGFYLSGVQHINIQNLHIHHMPGGGLRVSECEYINIIGNDIHDCSRRSYSGTHGLVVTKAVSTNTQEDYKIKIERNKVHHNYNEIYSWSPDKTFITPHIDEGKGISLQRNEVATGWLNGRILVANNLAYWNGYSGIHSNDGSRIDFIHNTCYNNSFTGTITNQGNGTGNNIGISFQGGNDFIIANNISVVDGSFGGYAISIDNIPNLIVTNNLMWSSNGTLMEDIDLNGINNNVILNEPQFVDASSFNFQLMSNSNAINSGSVTFTFTKDFLENLRDNLPDIGAYEYINLNFIDEIKNESKVFPNPCSNEIIVKESFDNLSLLDVNGNLVFEIYGNANPTIIPVKNLRSGLYFLNTEKNGRVSTEKIIIE